MIFAVLPRCCPNGDEDDDVHDDDEASFDSMAALAIVESLSFVDDVVQHVEDEREGEGIGKCVKGSDDLSSVSRSDVFSFHSQATYEWVFMVVRRVSLSRGVDV